MTDHKAKPLTRAEVLNHCASIRADGHEPLTLAVEPEILLATLDAQDDLLRRAEDAAKLAAHYKDQISEVLKLLHLRRGHSTTTLRPEPWQAVDEVLEERDELRGGRNRLRRILDETNAARDELLARLAVVTEALGGVMYLVNSDDEGEAAYEAADAALAATPEALTTWLAEKTDAAAREQEQASLWALGQVLGVEYRDHESTADALKRWRDERDAKVRAEAIDERDTAWLDCIEWNDAGANGSPTGGWISKTPDTRMPTRGETSNAAFWQTQLTAWERDHQRLLHERDAAFAGGVEAAIAKVETEARLAWQPDGMDGICGTRPDGEYLNRGRLLDALRALIPSTNKEG